MKAIANSAYAIETTNPPLSTDIIGIADFYDLIRIAADWLIVFGILIGAVFVVWGGIKYISAGGDEEGQRMARAMIINSLVGVIIIILAYSLVNFVGSFLGTEPIITPLTIKRHTSEHAIRISKNISGRW
ncbi:MAG: pilin [bacterium]|nr:pilin [bacterium]